MYQLGCTAVEHPRVYEIRTHDGGFNAVLPIGEELQSHRFCESDGSEFTGTVSCGGSKTSWADRPGSTDRAQCGETEACRCFIIGHPELFGLDFKGLILLINKFASIKSTQVYARVRFERAEPQVRSPARPLTPMSPAELAMLMRWPWSFAIMAGRKALTVWKQFQLKLRYVHQKVWKQSGKQLVRKGKACAQTTKQRLLRDK